MKFFLITFIGAFLTINPGNANASNPAPSRSAEDDWSSIRKDRDLTVAEPEFADTTGGLFNTCVTDTEIRSINPVVQCTEFKIIETAPSSSEFGEAEFHCLNKVSETVSISKEIQQTECEESVRFQAENENGACEKIKTTNTLPDNLTLNVLRSRGEAKGHTLFVKEYQLPRC